MSGHLVLLELSHEVVYFGYRVFLYLTFQSECICDDKILILTIALMKIETCLSSKSTEYGEVKNLLYC